MLIRYFKAIVLSIGVTYGLLFMMSSLIASGQSAITDDSSQSIVDFIRIKQELDVNLKNRKPEKPEKPAPPPQAPRPQLDTLAKINPGFSTGFSLNPELDISMDSLGSSDGDYLPIFKVAPIYPRRAAARGIEGYVILEFIVTKLGTVQDPQVIESVPPGIFDREAIKAALKFKYKPKVINGEPVDVAGVQNRIIFQLEDNGRR